MAPCWRAEFEGSPPSTSGIAVEGLFSGRARQELSNSVLGAEVNATMRLATGPTWRVDAPGGLRYLRLRETYTFLYASDVVRAPSQINRTINYSDATEPPALPTGPLAPSFKFRSSDFWARASTSAPSATELLGRHQLASLA